MSELMDIPEPRALPILGHANLIDSGFPLQSLVNLADQYGEIYRLRFPGSTSAFVSTQALVNECCDERRFTKSVKAPLEQIRFGVHDGLFTAHDGEENWGVAHRVLMPAFGPLSIKNMAGEMHDLASQLALKWARGGSEATIHVADDFTRLTLDTIALCSMGYRFNSFYTQDLHPFAEAMGDFLTEAGSMGRRPLPKIFYRAQDQKFQRDIDVMVNTAQEVLNARKNGQSDRDDLLAAMLKGVDPQTGKRMTDESIIDNLITFLIAGHETTSGMLSYAFYQLLTHPFYFAKAQAEVDTVCGTGPVKAEHLTKLPYLSAVLRETLRLSATIPVFTVEAREDTVIGGKYLVKKGEVVKNLLAKSHLDPRVFGDDAKQFKPDRMLDENFNCLMREFPGCWKPFGNGMRGCIGRPFAWQESLLIMAMLLQNFNFVLSPGYKLAHKQTLTIKPAGLTMRAILRDGLTPSILEARLAGSAAPESCATKPNAKIAEDDGKGIPLTVLYGSDSGTCKSFAQRVATDAPVHGFRALKLDCVDSVKGQLPTNHATVIITASYEGHPPSNAIHFVDWIKSLDETKQDMKGVNYAMFGCGNSEWVTTYHHVPRLIDSTLEKLGGERLTTLGLTDVSSGQTFADFETWEDAALWPALEAKYGGGKSTDDQPKGLEVVVTNPRQSTLQQETQNAIVLKAHSLTSIEQGSAPKKHIEIKLPKGMTYETGSYIAVLPVNPKQTVRRVMRAFGLSSDSYLEISSDVPVTLPIGISTPASEILRSYVELSQPATKRNILALADKTSDAEAQKTLQSMGAENYAKEINAKKVSVIDLLERFPSVELSIADFLYMMPPMRTRQYSVSSSALASPGIVSITFSVLHESALSGQGDHIGVATSYLNSLEEGDAVQVAIRPSPVAFSLPSDQERTPLLCIAAGTGLAPFRGFIQERATMIAAGRKLAPAILFFGCRSPDVDDLYKDEFSEWQRIGAVDVHHAYSAQPDASEGCKHVQDRLWHDRYDVVELWRGGAKVFLCGSSGVAESVREMVVKIKKETDPDQPNDEEAREWFHSLRNIRYVTDVFD